MKLRNVAIAAATVAAAFSSNAAGLSSTDQATLTATMAAGRYVSIAGASAVQAGFEALIASVLNNPVFYVDTGTAASANYIAVSGTLKSPNASFPAGSQVVIHYRVAGGSYNGIYPVARSLAIDALDVTSCSTTVGAGTAAVPYVCAVRGPIAKASNSALNGVGLVPDAGISDVAPEFFTVPDNLEGETPPTALSAAEVSSMATTPLYVQGFGIPLTANISSSFVMTKPIYSALMTGAFSDWNQVPGSTDSGPLVICRRIAGSGTQAVTNLFAGNTGCTTASVPTVDRSASSAYANVGGVRSYQASRVGPSNNGGTGLIVIENNTSGDVRKCMDAAYFGGSYTTADRDSKTQLTVNFGAGGYKAIGVLSMDSVGRSTNTVATGTVTLGNANGAWQFRALNGAGKITGDGITAATAATPVAPATSGTGLLPTLANLRTGDWTMQGYEAFNVRNSSAGDKQTVVQSVASAAQSAAILRGIASLSWASLSLPDFVTGNTTAAADVSNVVQAAHAANDQCAPLQRQY